MAPTPQPLVKHMLVSAPLYVADSVLSDLNTSVIKWTDIAAVTQLILLRRGEMTLKIDKLCSMCKDNIIEEEVERGNGRLCVCRGRCA